MAFNSQPFSSNENFEWDVFSIAYKIRLQAPAETQTSQGGEEGFVSSGAHFARIN
jgi:hypothetical protein